MLTSERLRELLDYDAAAGLFRWRKARVKARVGTRAGWCSGNGYRMIEIEGVTYAEHRLVWLHTEGREPASEIDHRNGNRSDNRRANLREASRRQNSGNTPAHCDNQHGIKGVTKGKRSARRPWQARIRVAGRSLYLGSFATAEEARAAYRRKAKEVFGVFAHSG